ERVADAAQQRRLYMRLVLRSVRKVEPKQAVERDRTGHVAHDDAEDVELRAHDASATASAVRRPSSGAIGCSASTTLRMWSSSSSPSPSAPAYTSSRWTPAANDGVLSFFLTDFGSSPSMPAGRTSPQACTKPDSSSQANSAFFRGVSRGIPRCSAWERTAS